MSESSTAVQQIEEVRRQTIAILDDLVRKAGEFELAEPPAAFERYRRKLQENSYKVLVVGEAKRGKSTFVNALIGRDVLPTDVDIATSQVFSIWPSRHEAYRLRFEDGSEREISLEDLPLYGSQVVADAGVAPTPDKIIRWIEIDAPIRFLPENVTILDTPGLGALYAGHAQITHRFVPEADAVIFVLESGQPVVEEDLKFIEEILSVTRNIFFIQTKIDQYSKEDWQDVQRRNREILEKEFRGRLADTRVWPVSSKNLRKAASADSEKAEEMYLMVSKHKELGAALPSFLARVSGWARATEAMQAAVQYHATGRKVLAGRLTGLTTESNQSRSDLQRKATENKQRFDAEWGPRGQRSQELRENLQQVMAVGRQSFSNILQPGGDIELAQKAKIDAIKILDEANRVAEELPGEVATAAMNGWAGVCKTVQSRCDELLEPFAEAAEELSAPLDPNVTGLATPGAGADERFKTDYWMMVRGAQSGAMLLTGVGSITSLLGVGSLASLTGGIGLVVVVPALVALVKKGFDNERERQVKAAQGQLRAELAETLQKMRRHFFDADQAAGSFGRVNDYFKALERSVNEQVREIVEKKSKEAEEEISRLTEAIKLDDQQRTVQAKQTREQLAKWDEIGSSAGNVVTRIKALEGARAAAPVPG